MIKRNDLAKQFSLVVQQEIINHNQAIESNNNKIESIKVNLENQCKSEEIKNKEYLDKFSKNQILLDEIKYNLSKLFQLHESLKKIVLDFHEKAKSEIHGFSLSSIYAVEKCDKLKNELNDLNSKFEHLNDIIFEYKVANSNLITECKKELNSNLKEFIKQEKDKPCKVEMLKEVICNKDQVFLNEIKCLKEEIEILKKKDFIKEKYQEKLFILIDRINKKMGD